MLIHLLTTDPATPADVLTHLAGRANLTPAQALAIAAHPHLPAHAGLSVPTQDSTDLRAALAHPRLPPARRAAFIDACASPTALARTIRDCDAFTPDELTTAYARLGRVAAFAHNSRTPTHIAAEVVAEIHASGRQRPLADVTALRHHLPPRNPWTGHASRSADPLAAYARLHLADNGAGVTGRGAGWWLETLTDFPHPLITAAALDLASHPATPTTLRTAIARTIASDLRATPDHRYRAVEVASHTLHSVADTAPDATLRSLLRRTAYPSGWNNPRASAATLRVLHRQAVAHPSADELGVACAIVLHPATSPGLRRDVLAAHPHAPAWLPRIAHYLNTAGPAGALDATYTDLRAAAATTPHALHWARAAWAAHHTQPVTLAYAHALLTLDTPTFPGTLRELLDAGTAIAA